MIYTSRSLERWMQDFPMKNVFVYNLVEQWDKYKVVSRRVTHWYAVGMCRFYILYTIYMYTKETFLQDFLVILKRIIIIIMIIYNIYIALYLHPRYW